MNELWTTLSNVLVGTLGSDDDTDAIIDRFRAAGGDAGRLVVLRGQDGIDRLVGTPMGGPLARWVRQMRRMLDGITAHIVDTAVDDLSAGRTVVIIRDVKTRDAAAQARRLRLLGATHVHYSGRWTSVDHGAVPAANTYRTAA